MNKEQTLQERIAKLTGYYSLREGGIIAILAILAVFSGIYAPKYLLPGGSVPTLMHTILKLPGPGAGIMVFGGTLCFCLVLGLLLINKPGTAVVMSLLVIAIDLLIGQQPVSAVSLNFHSLDVILFVAIIIEILALLPLDKVPLKYVMPILLAGLGTITLYLFITGQAKMGENGAAATDFPLGYVIIAILALCYAIICYRYPVKYLAACAIANMYYILHFWLFFGKSFAVRFPAAPDIILVLLCVAAVGGVLFATAAYGIDLLLKMYMGTERSVMQDQ
jgi:hypothetical protein